MGKYLKKYCCDKFEEHVHDLSIGIYLDDLFPYPFINLSVYTYGSVDLLEEMYERIYFCPFCGSKLKEIEG